MVHFIFILHIVYSVQAFVTSSEDQCGHTQSSRMVWFIIWLMILLLFHIKSFITKKQRLYTSQLSSDYFANQLIIWVHFSVEPLM